MPKPTHKTKDGRTAKKGLYYNINKKKKAGKKMRKKGAKGAPSAADFKAAAKTAKKPKKAAAYGGEIKMMKDGGKFPDLSGDGKITQKDILMGKGVIPKPMKSGGEFSRGCGAVMPNRRKKTKYA
tara:strand:- start:59 stop:433 length:375 start_codon:yes stop_codon:yes gene_type:complete